MNMTQDFRKFSHGLGCADFFSHYNNNCKL
jgi:hypothetical protein